MLVTLVSWFVKFQVWVFEISYMYIRGFTKFGIKVLWRLQFLEYLRTLNLKFQKAQTKIEVVLSLPCWLSQFTFWLFSCVEHLIVY